MSSPLDRSTIRSVRRRILAWYAADHRDFPWRGVDDPYRVLVSEVMLQQTQASRVAERFPRFIERFPTATALASAPPSAVLAEWSGLGYNRRALALQRAVAGVALQGWPRDVTGLRRLPGIGPYTARAVASLAFDLPVGVVDTNVRRWILRRFGGPDRPGRLQAVSDALAAPGRGSRVSAWTHASMEFGAAICRARAPRCTACPIAEGCPSRGQPGVVTVARQPRLRGSDRAYRGAVLRILTSAQGHRRAEGRLRADLELEDGRIGPGPGDGAWERIMLGLERDGLVQRSHGVIRLGAATIGA